MTLLKEERKRANFFNRLLPMKKEQYKQINNDRLVLYGVYLLEKKEIEPTFDNVVMAVFKLFPERFSLIGFPHYPDAKRVHDCLWHCTYKTKHWLDGNAKSGFRLSKKGQYILEETFSKMKGKIKVGKVFDTKVKRKEVFFIDWIKKTGAFKKYTNGKGDSISEVEVREFLRVSNEASKDIMRQNLEKYRGYVRKIGDPLVEEFLKFIEGKWGSLFE